MKIWSILEQNLLPLPILVEFFCGGEVNHEITET
jgi:hypothetical protein